ncbi:MAG TPA: ABC transporter permease [Clostridiaceae bacterium]|nr:ABC transporter permease [Clostridiaceae bacterium]
MRQTKGEKIFEVFNVIIMCLLALVTLYPMINVLAVSLSRNDYVVRGEVTFYPIGFTLKAYNYLFKFSTILDGYRNTLFLVIVGTALNLFFTAMTAYALSKRDLIGRNLFLFLIVFTMMFGGGMIPNYLLVKDLHLINSLWSLILPGTISAYNLIIMKNFFQAIPRELIESSRIDGLSEMGILFRMVIPLSLPALTTIGLFYAVGHWNSFFDAIIYINNKKKWPLQLILRDILFFADTQQALTDDISTNIPLEPLKMATVIGTTLPVLVFYPFIQKYFVKGVMIGSVKG